MTEIEQKALALVNEVKSVKHLPGATYTDAFKALCRAIEQHEAFRQEVSDAVEATLTNMLRIHGATTNNLLRKCLGYFIIAKPDPLAEAWIEATGNTVGMEPLNEAIAKRGGKIVWGEK